MRNRKNCMASSDNKAAPLAPQDTILLTASRNPAQHLRFSAVLQHLPHHAGSATTDVTNCHPAVCDRPDTFPPVAASQRLNANHQLPRLTEAFRELRNSLQ